MSSSTRVVRMAAVVGSGEEPEFPPSDVVASYRLRTSREHNDAEMQLTGVVKTPLNVGRANCVRRQTAVREKGIAILGEEELEKGGRT